MTLLHSAAVAATAVSLLSTAGPGPRRDAGVTGTVTKIEMVARPKSFTGTCPAKITFTGAIHVSAPGTEVEYRWERSDGATGPKRKVVIKGAGLGVNDTWTLGGSGDHLAVGEKLHVLVPNEVVSQMVMAKVVCR